MVQESLKGCAGCNLYETFLFPPKWIQTGQRTGRAQTHQGALNIPDATGRLFLEILEFGTNIIALTFTGKNNSDRYIGSWIQSGAAARFALAIICYKKAEMGLVANDFDPAVAIDDFEEMIETYQAAEFLAFRFRDAGSCQIAGTRSSAGSGNTGVEGCCKD